MANAELTRKRRRWLKISVGLVGLLFGSLLIASSCVTFRKSPKEIDAFFAGKPEQPRYGSYIHDGRQMHFVEIGDEDARMVLFIHGSPGSWDAFLAYFGEPELLENARIVAVDRPGFGDSGRNQVETSLARQAADIEPILAMDDSAEGPIIVAHSLGGPVAVRLAMDYPDEVGSLILLAPSVDPELEKIRWYQRVAEWPFVRWLVPGPLVTSNREIMPLAGELKQLDWSTIHQPVTVIQGEEDSLVPIANSDFIREKLPQAQIIRLPKEDHFIPWTQEELVLQTILKQLKPSSTSPD